MHPPGGGESGPMLLSIVTPCLNRACFIAEAIESVLRQDYPAIEHLVVDGGSTDGTLEVVRRYPNIRVVSESDQGVYHALNKGIHLARGEVVGHLNSDDVYADGIFAEVMRRFEEDPELEAVYGGATVFEEASGRRCPMAEYTTADAVSLSFPNITLGVPIINARFFRKRLLSRLGDYDLRYAIAADREFLLRVALANIRAAYLTRPVYHYRQHPGSLSISPGNPRQARILDEYLAIAERYGDLPGIPDALRVVLRQWHTRESVERMLLALRAGECGAALRYVRRGWGRDAAWPAALLGRVLRRVRRGFRRA